MILFQFIKKFVIDNPLLRHVGLFINNIYTYFSKLKIWHKETFHILK